MHSTSHLICTYCSQKLYAQSCDMYVNHSGLVGSCYSVIVYRLTTYIMNGMVAAYKAAMRKNEVPAPPGPSCQPYCSEMEKTSE